MRELIHNRTVIAYSISLGLMLGLTSSLTAAADTPRTSDELAVATAAIDTARSSGAAELAPLELSLAREKLERAERLASAGNKTEARLLAEEANVDAQAARSKSGAIRANRSLNEVQASMRALQEELNRGASISPAGASGTGR